MKPSQSDLTEIFQLKYGADPEGWGPRLRLGFQYFTPDDVYETVVAKHVRKGATWLDVGGGSSIFPSNEKLARKLADRAGVVVGVDPSSNIFDNPYVHDRANCILEEYRTDRQFDLATMRMVVEHVADPAAFAAALSRLVRPGGKVIVHTVNRWSPVTFASWATPISVHHAVKKVLWGTDEKDTFPVVYKMNTRRQLSSLFSRFGFEESDFLYLDDCRSFARWRIPNLLELSLWRALKALRAPYVDTCLLGVYSRL